MKVKEVPYSWIPRWGYRLDVEPFVGGAVETRVFLEKAPYPKHPLHELTTGHNGGIYNGPMFRRNYVESPEHGVPFLTSGSMLRADLSDVGLLRRKDAESPKLSYLRLTRGTTLISCSGSIGRTVYTRPDMEGMWASQDIMKVVPDPAKVPPGFLFAFLSSKFGVSMVTSGTYGAIIQHIEPEHIADLPVPRLGANLEGECHRLVEDAAAARYRATTRLEQAQSLLTSGLDLDVGAGQRQDQHGPIGQMVLASEISGTTRLEGYFYNAKALRIEQRIRERAAYRRLDEVADVYDVPPFKHIYVAASNGVPFFTSGDLFTLDRRADKFLSRTRTKNLHLYVLERGWVLLARSGQLGGILGKPQYSDSALEGAATSDHVIRIVPKKGAVPAGYLYAYLASPSIGYPLITRTMTGHSIPALWPSQLNSLPFLPLSEGEMKRIHTLVEEAFELRVKATALEDDARSLVERILSRG